MRGDAGCEKAEAFVEAARLEEPGQEKNAVRVCRKWDRVEDNRSGHTTLRWDVSIGPSG